MRVIFGNFQGICVRSVFFFAVAIASVFFATASNVNAALLYFDPTEISVHRGDTITVALRIDTEEGECINTIDAVIKYDASIRAVDVSRGSSILNIWVENPVIDEQNHTISFAGGLPGGYCGRIPGDPRLTNIVAELVFRSPGLSIGGGNNPEAKIWIDDSTQVLLHDGLGTNATVRTNDAKITLLDTAGSVQTDEWTGAVQADDEPPSDFSVTLTKDETAFSGDYFIVFNSNDKQSGIDHYEVMEEPFEEFYTFKWGRADAPWIVTESPFVLKDQTLNSTIRVKAIDKAGNERIVQLVPDPALQSMSKDRLLTLLVVGGAIVLVSVLAIYAIWRRKQKVIQSEQDEHES